MRLFWILMLAVLIASPAGAMDVRFKECLQRGYTTKSDPATDIKYCIFPDGSKCPLEEFNRGECGHEFLTDDYCIAKGNYVWDEGMCCEGTEPQLREGGLQSRCMEVSYLEDLGRINPFPFVVIGIVLLASIVLWSIFRISRKKNAAKDTDREEREEKKR